MLVSLVGDKNDHGDGALQSPPQTKFTVSGLLVCTVDTVATPDNLLHPTGPTNASTGSSKWTLAGKAVHRQGDMRYCGAKTIVSSQTKFTVGT